MDDNIMKKNSIDDETPDAVNEEKATFTVQVLYHQNSTWQGTVKWMEKQEQTNFRSAMELLQIMGGVVDREKNN